MSNVIVYSIIGAPAFYMGKVHTETSEHLVLCDAIMGISEKGGSISLVRIPHTSKESRISIPISQVPGLKIENPDEELVSTYEDSLVRAFSKLTLV